MFKEKKMDVTDCHMAATFYYQLSFKGSSIIVYKRQPCWIDSIQISSQ